MNKPRCFLILLFTVNLFICRSQVVEMQVHWKQFMEKQDMVWNEMPGSWDEGPFMGNGVLGLMMYQPKDSNMIRFDIGNSYVQDHRTDTYGSMPYSRPRLPIGYFYIVPKGRIIQSGTRLDIWNATTGSSIKTNKGSIFIHAYVHAVSMVIIIDVKTTGDEPVPAIQWQGLKAVSPRQTFFAVIKKDSTRMMKGYIPNPEFSILTKNKVNSCIQPLLVGGETVTSWTVTKSGRAERVFINVSHSFPEKTAYTASIKAIGGVLHTDSKILDKQHYEWWHHFFRQSFISLPDKKLESFYWIQLYKLASATRSNGAVIDNQGPWLEETAWPYATWNLNVQLTYWLCYASNHTELSNSLLNVLEQCKDTLIKNVPEQYRYNSAGIGRATTNDCVGPVEPAWQVKQKGNGSVSEIACLPWTCHNLWLQYRFSMDDSMLKKKLFPLLKLAINYYLHFAEKKEDCKYHLPYTYSPEYGIAKDCNIDLALLKWGCETLLKSCERLHMQDSLMDKWKDVSANLVDFPSDVNGFRIGADQGYDMSHRHFSHLLMVYPLFLVNTDQPESKNMILKSLHYWHSKPEALAAYSYIVASSISSSIGDGENALKYLHGLFTKFLRPNTMYKEWGPVIESPLAGAQSILDMYIQSWNGKIRVFPAIPPQWEDVCFDRLNTEGAFWVSASRKHGETQFVSIVSKAGEPCILNPSIKGEIVFKSSDPGFSYKKLDNGFYQLYLKKGARALLYPATTKNFSIEAVKLNAGKENYFGSQAKYDLK